MKKLFILLCIATSVIGQKLPRALPEAMGVSSSQIQEFISAWEGAPLHEPHSLMVLRKGKVIAEGWWSPYARELPHTMYSVSKSFTATAIGFAVAEGKCDLDDPVLSFFPEERPQQPSENLQNLRIRDLLTMSTGNEKEPLFMLEEDNWAAAFLRSAFPQMPGSHFLYNSPATYMLSAIVQKVTGERLIDFLQPRLFKPLGITGVDWEVDGQGINTGGWGLRLKTEDMAKFGQLFLQKGKWEGKQILPFWWVEEATKPQVYPQARTPEQAERSDWHQGYGFQMWRGKNNSFRADGAYGQNIIVLPEKEVVIVTTGESADLQGFLNLIWEKLLPAFSSSKELPGKAAPKALKQKLSQLRLTPPVSQVNVVAGTPQRWVFLEEPYHGLRALHLDWKDNRLEVGFDTDSVKHTLPFAEGEWALSETTMKGPYLLPRAKANRSVIASHKVAAAYAWKDTATLELVVKYYENMHTETIRLHFAGEEAEVEFDNIVIRGRGAHRYPAVRDNSNTQSPRLIIRGDDMGYSHSGNRALLKASLEGIQTSIEVLAPAPWFPEAVKMLQDNPQIDVGLHFALTSEWDNVKWRPLTAAPSLRDSDGYFYPMLFKNNHYKGRALMDHAFTLSDIEVELRAQIELLRRHIPWMSHISGHMGCTLFSPEVKALVRRVAAEYGLPVVDSDAVNDFGISYLWMDARKKNTEERIDAFIQLLDSLTPNKAYVFVEHPGFDDAELRAIHHIGYENVAEDRQAVTDLFLSPKVKRAIYRKGIKLVSYKELLSR